MRKVSPGNILHITHPWGGGISTYLQDLSGLFGDSLTFSVLTCCEGKLILRNGKGHDQRVFSYGLPRPVRIGDFFYAPYAERLKMILEDFDIRIVHLNSAVGHTFDIFNVPKLLRIPLIFTVHDFYYICPTFHMVDASGIYCGGCELGQEKEDCLRNHPYVNHPDFDSGTLNRWRREFLRLQTNIDLFIFPSFSAKNIFSSFFHIKSDRCRVIYHGTNIGRGGAQHEPEKADVLRVGILGSMLRHKGEPLIRYILEDTADNKIRFFHFGDGNLKDQKLVNYGRYERSEIVDVLQEHQIDVILLLSTWPETFSYTLSEAIVAGIPPIVTNMGALKERVDGQDIGWVVDYDDPAEICRLLRFLRRNRGEVETRRRHIKEVGLKTMAEMERDYLDVYRSFLFGRRKGSRLWETLKRCLGRR